MNNYCKLMLLGVFSLSLSTAFAGYGQKNDKNKAKKEEKKEEKGPKCCGTQFFFTGDFIYWQAQEDGLTLGQDGVSDITYDPATGASSVIASGKTQTMDFEYNPGFKFGAGLKFAHDKWDTYMNYTWYEATDVHAHSGVRDLTSQFDDDAVYHDFGHETATWNLYFNNIDWELGRMCALGSKFNFRPHFGIKGAWNHQNFATDLVTVGVGHVATHESTSYQKQKYWGVGLRAGVNAEWILPMGFSIYGDFAFSELYGQFQVKSQLDTDSISGHAFDATVDIDNTYNIHRLRPVVELALGAKYQVHFGKRDCYCFFIQTGWEQQIWWEQNQMQRNFDDNGPRDGDLMFQGLDVKVGFVF